MYIKINWNEERSPAYVRLATGTHGFTSHVPVCQTSLESSRPLVHSDGGLAETIYHAACFPKRQEGAHARWRWRV